MLEKSCCTQQRQPADDCNEFSPCLNRKNVFSSWAEQKKSEENAGAFFE